MSTEPCPKCSGAGKIVGMFPVYAEHVPLEDRKPFVEIHCRVCRGRGKVGPRTLLRLQLGRELRDYRKSLGIGLRQMAAELGGDVCRIYDHEQGLKSPRSITRLRETYARVARNRELEPPAPEPPMSTPCTDGDDLLDLADRLTEPPTSSTGYMSHDERYGCVHQMILDLDLLARGDGCIAAAWALEKLASLARIHHERPTTFGCTPQQYHAGLDKLWAALGLKEVQDDDVFTLAARAIAERDRYRAALEEIVRYWDSCAGPFELAHSYRIARAALEGK